MTDFRGPEMTWKKASVLLLTAAVILVLFMVRTCQEPEPQVAEIAPRPVDYVYISPYDSIFRNNADSVFDWKLLAAVAYAESRFKDSLVSKMGASGLMQIVPRTYERMLRRMELPDTLERTNDLDVKVAVFLMHELEKKFPFVTDPDERLNFILASYNSGSGHVLDAARYAQKHGMDRSSWADVCKILRRLNEEEVYGDSICRNGSFNAGPTVRYVKTVRNKYNEYCSKELMFKAVEQLKDNIYEIYNND